MEKIITYKLTNDDFQDSQFTPKKLAEINSEITTYTIIFKWSIWTQAPENLWGWLENGHKIISINTNKKIIVVKW